MQRHWNALIVVVTFSTCSLLSGTTVTAFAVSPSSFVGIQSSHRSSWTSTISATTTTATTDTDPDANLVLPYEVEKLPLRIGHGFDIHRMAPRSMAGQPIVIAGVEIVHDDQKWKDLTGEFSGTPGAYYETQLGVVAHSDGDIVYHSIVDAIFGALTLPDIGQIFPDTDPRWKGCDSGKFMEHAHKIMRQYGYQIGNVDVTLILERPKVASFKPAMKENIVRLLETSPGRVNIKARTHERVDSVGELRSLLCHVVLTLELLQS